MSSGSQTQEAKTGDQHKGQGAKHCVACAKGRFQVKKESVVGCTTCTAGKYLDQTGKSVCKPCPKGRYNHDNPGTHKDHDNIDDCKSCEVGKYQPEGGKILCQDCTAGKYQENQNAIVQEVRIGAYDEYARQARCEPMHAMPRWDIL